MNQYFRQSSPYGKIPLDFDMNFSGGNGELPNHTEKRQLMLLSTVVGLCVISFIGLQQIVPFIIIKFGLLNMYFSNELVRISIDTLASIFCILLPFSIAYKIIKKRITPTVDILPYNKPVSYSLFGLAIAMGMFALMISNYITSAFVYYMDDIGVKFTSPELEEFKGGIGVFLMYLVRGAVVPALVEEFSLRGIVMQPLRKFGDSFAIVISSLLFAVMHGNMVQAPFAFLLGSAIGYLVIITDSLWTGVLIHFINNAYAITMTAVSSKMEFETYFMVYTICSIIILLVGGAATAYFFSKRIKYPYLNKRGGVTKRLRRQYFRSVAKTYLLNPALLVAFGLLIYNMSSYTSIGG